MKAAPEKSHRWLGAILLGAALSRLAYLAWYRAHDPLFGFLLHDAARNDRWARAIAAGTSFEPGAYYQAPGYGFFLGAVYRLFDGSTTAALLLQSLLGLATVALVYRIASRVRGSRAGLVAAALAAFYRPYPFFETKLLSATLAVFLVCVVVDRLQAASSSRHVLAWAPAGLALGAACVTRPNLLLLLPAVVVWMLLDRGRTLRTRLAGALLVAGTAGLVVAPVTIRNHRASGELVLVAANGGVTFYQGNNAPALGVFSPGELSGSIGTQRAESRTLAERATGQSLSDAEVSAFWFQKGLEFARRHPGRWLLLEARKAFLAIDDHEHALNYSPELDPNPFRWLFPFSFALVLALAAMRPFSGRRPPPEEWPLLLVLAVEAGTLLLFFAVSRYRLPATAPLLALAGCGALTLADRLRARRALAPLLVALAVAGLSLWKLPPDGARLYRRLSVNALADRGVALMAAGRGDEAIDTLSDAVSRDATNPLVRVDLAKAYRSVGDLAGAERALLEALEVAPRLPAAHAALGGLYLEQRRMAAAERHLWEALRGNPADAFAANAMLELYARQNRPDEARRLLAQMRRARMRVRPELERWILANGGG